MSGWASPGACGRGAPLARVRSGPSARARRSRSDDDLASITTSGMPLTNCAGSGLISRAGDRQEAPSQGRTDCGEPLWEPEYQQGAPLDSSSEASSECSGLGQEVRPSSGKLPAWPGLARDQWGCLFLGTRIGHWMHIPAMCYSGYTRSILHQGFTTATDHHLSRLLSGALPCARSPVPLDRDG